MSAVEEHIPRQRRTELGSPEPRCPPRPVAVLKRSIKLAWCNPWVRCLVVGGTILGVPLNAMRVRLHDSSYSESFFAANRSTETLQDKGFKIHWDGWNPIDVPRKVVDGPIMEMLYSFDAKQGFEVRDDRVFIPFKRPISGTYVRDYHQHNIHEFGFFNQMWMVNPYAVFGGALDQDNRINVGLGEKLHVLSQDGKWNPKSLKRVETEKTNRSFLSGRVAKLMRHNRFRLVSAWIGKSHVGPASIYSGFDLSQRTKTRDFADQNDGSHEDDMMLKLAAKRSKLKEKLASNEVWPPPTGTAANCHHMEGLGVPGFLVEDDGVWLPLRRKIVTYRGQTIFTPIQRYAAVQGVSFLNFNRQTNALEMYVSASGFVNVEDQSLPDAEPPTFFVSPVDGRSAGDTEYPVGADGRTMPAWNQPSRAAAAAYTAWQRLPADYDFLFRDPEDACPPAVFDRVQKEMDSLKLHELVQQHDPSIIEAMEALHSMTNSVDCGLSLLAADTPNSHSMGPFESMVWNHFLLETPDGDKMGYVGTRHWNDPPSGITLQLRDRDSDSFSSVLDSNSSLLENSSPSPREEKAVACFARLADLLEGQASKVGRSEEAHSRDDGARRLRKRGLGRIEGGEEQTQEMFAEELLSWCLTKLHEVEAMNGK